MVCDQIQHVCLRVIEVGEACQSLQHQRHQVVGSGRFLLGHVRVDVGLPVKDVDEGLPLRVVLEHSGEARPSGAGLSVQRAGNFASPPHNSTSWVINSIELSVKDGISGSEEGSSVLRCDSGSSTTSCGCRYFDSFFYFFLSVNLIYIFKCITLLFIDMTFQLFFTAAVSLHQLVQVRPRTLR
ncbi:unnamed protein product [Moneuplotes crassus]|uniref:Uncharacterized protein n=1 Tax=Euplotes crassus TaxID=5936 RepID=A0AAD1UFW0_EUPCR|nr:unnamed protein product [Moneuplotes crassus]